MNTLWMLIQDFDGKYLHNVFQMLRFDYEDSVLSLHTVTYVHYIDFELDLIYGNYKIKIIELYSS